MPERVTKEERIISLAIEKARSAKEELQLSLENNRNPADDKLDIVKLKRPKAQKDTTKFEENKGPVNEHGYAGEVTEFKKSLDVMKFTIRGEGGVGASKEQIREIELLIRQVDKDLDRMLAGLKDGSIGQKEFQEESQKLIREFNVDGILKPVNRFR